MRSLFGSRMEIAFSAGLLLWAVLEALFLPGEWSTPVRLAFALAATAPLALRHRFPCAVAVWAVVAFVVDGLLVMLPYVAVTPLQGLIVALFALAAYAERRRRALGGIALFLLLPLLFHVTEREVPVTLHDSIALLVFELMAASAGWAVRARREESEQTAAATARADAARALSLRDGVAGERRRIARELHAIVTRDLAAIERLAARARATVGHTDDPAASRTDEHVAARALAEISRTASAALEELRRLLHVLRADEAAVSGAQAAPPIAHSAPAFAQDAPAIAQDAPAIAQDAPGGSGGWRRAWVVDVVAAAVAVAALVGEQAARGGGGVTGGGTGGDVAVAGWVSGVALIVLPLLLLRSRAGLAAALVLAVGGLGARTLLGWMPSGGLSLVVVLVFAPYAAAAHAATSTRASVGGAVAVVVSLTTIGLAMDSVATDLAIVAAIAAFSWFAGWRVRSSTHRTAGLRRADQRGAAAAPRRLRDALDAERTRVARDLHDVVAHGVSLIGLLAGAARATLPHDPARAETALADLADTAAATRIELARLLDALRAGDEPAAGATCLADLDALAAGARRAGQRVTLQLDRDALAAVPAGVLASACGIVQEALTNARKHALGAAVEVAMGVEDGARPSHDSAATGAGAQAALAAGDGATATLAIAVVNAAAAPGSARAAGAQRGLEGMRERARLLGGAVAAGP
ncbi:histidine kinase, partial [Conexibacter sp. JD483]|uniref:histidine kinase n=2 Tax=Conexibacter TaxID=191494 RepID=UPI002870B015